MQLDPNTLKRFWAKVNKTPTCWLWIGAKDGKGYGRFGYQGHNRRAHRISFIFHYGPPLPGFLICHHCDNPPCVNPSHLFLGTLSDNRQDGIKKGRFIRRYARFTEEMVRSIRNRVREGQISQRQLARELGVNSGDINHIVLRKTWKHIID